jgi:hypothetical protein
MSVSEERLQILLPKSLKDFLKKAARRRGLSVGAYIRGLIEADRKVTETEQETLSFPFGEKPIRTGRTTGSVSSCRGSPGMRTRRSNLRVR